MTVLKNAPTFSDQEALLIAKECYDLDAVVKKNLPSERDQNFLLETSHGLRVLKVSNLDESRDVLAAQNQMMIRLFENSNGKKGLGPEVFAGRSGELLTEYKTETATWNVRLVDFVQGTPLAELGYFPSDFFQNFGSVVGQVTESLSSLESPALQYDFRWDLRSALSVIEGNIHRISDSEVKESIQRFTKVFKDKTLVHLEDLATSVLHNDLNDGNVIVVSDASVFPPKFEVAGVIDFGDAVFGWTVGELAIAIAYAILDRPDPLEIIQLMVRGYCKHRNLSSAEVNSLFGLIGIRLCQSAAIAAYQMKDCPDNEYLNVSQVGIKNTLPLLNRIPYQVATAVIRKEAGIDCSKSDQDRIRWIESNKGNFADPVRIDGSKGIAEVSCALDLSVESELVPADIENYSIEQLQERLEAFLKGQGAKIGIGGYLESRLIYQGDHYKTGARNQSLTAPRTVHLGIDYFCPVGTEVCSVFDGTIVSLERIERERDYGNVVVVRNETDTGIPFFTLYGHLGSSVHSKWKVGQKIGKGVQFARIGHPSENGGWPPHLHFQLLTEFDSGNNPPGVCSGSWVEAWSESNLDPNLLFGYSDEMLPAGKMSFEESLKTRQTKMGGSLSLGYDRPLKMVRGTKHYLFDHTGRRYLDSFNNVPHVGHANKNVVESLRKQASLLNTNTRYLNDVTLKYADRLAATMPDPLNVVFLVNSASEANELALRMTRAVTGSKHMIVLEAGYHGNTSSLIDISPYKHEGPGGQGAPDWVHKAVIADCYRGPFKDPKTAGRLYAENVQEVIGKIQSIGGNLSGYIAESCPSVGGQILFPENYLKHTYQFVREAGGLCIADEVQTGFGRLGSHFYGFQMQDVVPDIVILGKPIGNGHPLAALVTTKEIADGFNNGMEYFSTFGGNMVSSAVGNAVLEEIKNNDLQKNALEVGGYLLDLLRPFQDKYSFVGDVRGSGFFLGVELVRDSVSLEPADKEASFVSNRMKDRGVLLGTDGPFHNVIKIRPPMTFQKNDADVLVNALGECFEELRFLMEQ